MPVRFSGIMNLTAMVNEDHFLLVAALSQLRHEALYNEPTAGSHRQMHCHVPSSNSRLLGHSCRAGQGRTEQARAEQGSC